MLLSVAAEQPHTKSPPVRREAFYAIMIIALRLDKQAEFLAVFDRLLCHGVAVFYGFLRHVAKSGRTVRNDLKRLSFFHITKRFECVDDRVWTRFPPEVQCEINGHGLHPLS